MIIQYVMTPLPYFYAGITPPKVPPKKEKSLPGTRYSYSTSAVYSIYSTRYHIQYTVYHSYKLHYGIYGYIYIYYTVYTVYTGFPRILY